MVLALRLLQSSLLRRSTFQETWSYCQVTFFGSQASALHKGHPYAVSPTLHCSKYSEAPLCHMKLNRDLRYPQYRNDAASQIRLLFVAHTGGCR